MSYFKVIEAEATTNFALNPAWRLDANYAAEAGTTVSQSATYSKYGAYSLRVQCNANDEGAEITLSALANAIHRVTMRIAGTLPAAWDWSLDDAAWTVPTLVEAIDATWDLYECNFTAAQANASVKLSVHQNGAGAGDFYIDGVQVEAKDGYYTTFCDGEQEGCEWIGPANASRSSRSAASLAGGRIRDLEDDYDLYIERMVSVGAGPISLSTDSYAVLPGGYVSSEKDGIREFVLAGKIWDTSLSSLHSGRQDLAKVLRPNVPGNQAITLRYTGSAAQKEIRAYYTDGLGGDIQAVKTQINAYENVNVRFVAVDPYWYEIGESAEILDDEDTIAIKAVMARLKSTGQWDNLGMTNPVDGAGPTLVIVYNPVDGRYYLGGEWTGWDSVVDSDYIVAYNPNTDAWEPLPAANNPNATVRAIAVAPNGDVYIGGDFTNVGDGDGDYVAYYDISGDVWASVEPDGVGDVYALAFDGSGNLYIGGDFTLWDGDGDQDRITMWDGAAYNAVGAGLNGAVYALAYNKVDDLMYIGGAFTADQAAGALVRVCSYNGTAFAQVNGATGISAGTVWTLGISSGGIVYIAGDFTNEGDSNGDYIVSWDGQAFSSLGPGLDGIVYGMTIAPNGDVWVAGVLTYRMKMWNGASWTYPDANPTAVNHWCITTGPQDPVVKSNYDVWIAPAISGNVDIAGITTITNTGTAESFPKITFEATLGGLVARLFSVRNETTGRVLNFSYLFVDGEKLTVDLSPTEKKITSSFFGAVPDAIFANSDFALFSLVPGANDITCFINQTGGGGIVAVTCTYRTAYNGLD